VQVFVHDADSKRVSKQDGDGFTELIYQGPDMLKLLMERDEEGETLAHYTMGNGLEAMRQEAESSFYHFDALGSTYRLTDAVEEVTDTYRYNAWGEILGTTGETFNRHTFVGRERYSMSRTPSPPSRRPWMRAYLSHPAVTGISQVSAGRASKPTLSSFVSTRV